MLKKKWMWRFVAAASLMAISGVAYGLAATGSLASQPAEAAVVCPLTGEELPGPRCCPLNR